MSEERAVAQMSHFEAPALRKIIARWLAGLDLMPRTKMGYERGLKRFLPLFGEKGAALRREDVLTWREMLRAQGVSVSSLNQYLAAVRCFFKWLESEKLFPDITANIKRYRVDYLSPRGRLHAEDVRKILGQIAASKGISAKRDYALFNLIVRTGLRTIEVEEAVCGDLKEDEGRQTLWVRGKGRMAKDRAVVLTEEAYGALLTYLESRGYKPDADKDKPIFESLTRPGQPLRTRTIRYLWKLYAKEAGMENTSPHWLRHTFATLALEGGADVLAVKDALRHTRLESTLRYVHLNRFHKPAEDAVKI